jgi:hypothetical protein
VRKDGPFQGHSIASITEKKCLFGIPICFCHERENELLRIGKNSRFQGPCEWEVRNQAFFLGLG